MATSSPQSPQEPKGYNGGELSSGSSASDLEDEFVVDKIIAQSVPEKSDGDEEEMYLVRWEGYPDEQCTWEPKESFLSRETLELWDRDKLQGQILNQDEVDEIVRKMDAYADAEEERRKKRRIQKEQLASSGKSRSPVVSKTNKNLASTSPTSRLDLHGSRDSAGSRLVKPGENTGSAKSHDSGHLSGLLSPRTTNSRTKNFQGIGVEPRARRSSHRPLSTRPKGIPGAHFKTLRTQYRHQKAGRNEPAPDLGKIKLKSVSDIVAAAGEDIAHILPSGDWRPVLSPNLDLRSTQPIPDHINQSGPVPEMSTNALQRPLTLIPRQHDSVFGNMPRITSISNSSVSTAINTQRQDLHRLPNGRYWLSGEVLLHLTLHEQMVGDVRVGGLPNWFKLKLISLKIEHRILVDFHLVEFWQYDTLCRGRSNDLIANAYVAPFEDSQAAVAELADSLVYKNRAALWYHPDNPYVLVAYAAASNDWRFLDGGHAFPPEFKIHLALRNSMPKIEMLATLQPPEGRAIPAGSGEAVVRPQTQLTSPDLPMQGVNLHASHEIVPRVAENDVAVIVKLPKPGFGILANSKALSSSNGNATQRRQSEPLISIVSMADDVRDSDTFLHHDLTNPWLVGSSVEPDDEYSGSSSDSEERPTPPFEFTVPCGENIDAAFKNQFGISYNYLTRPSVMPASHKEMLDPGRARFYLAFPLSYRAEMEALRAFLSNHTLPNLICTTAESQGWDGFKTILGDKLDNIGVIIFHSKYTNYSGLPGLAKLLKMVNVNLFNLSLRQALPYCDLPMHIERLFPNGTAILLTESAMMQQPERTLAILRWFSHTVKTKRGTWKIVLVPNVRHWLRQTAVQAGDLQACFLDMLTEISELSQGQPINYRSLADEESEAESLDGCDDEVGKASLVVSPANIPAYHRCRGLVQNSTEFEGDKILIQWFAGWAALNAQRHRKFPAISGVAPFLSEKSDRWGHIEVVDPNKYMLQNKIPFQRPSATDPPSQSPE